MRIHWKEDLGNPPVPGKYSVKGIGEVTVRQEEINQAAKFDGDTYVEIVETITMGQNVPQFILGHFIPA